MRATTSSDSCETTVRRETLHTPAEKGAKAVRATATGVTYPSLLFVDHPVTEKKHQAPADSIRGRWRPVFAVPDDVINTQGAVIAVFNWLDEARRTIAPK